LLHRAALSRARMAVSAPGHRLFLRNNLIWCKLSPVPAYFLIGFQWAE
jgi:hypothetical protein